MSEERKRAMQAAAHLRYWARQLRDATALEKVDPGWLRETATWMEKDASAVELALPADHALATIVDQWLRGNPNWRDHPGEPSKWEDLRPLGPHDRKRLPTDLAAVRQMMYEWQATPTEGERPHDELTNPTCKRCGQPLSEHTRDDGLRCKVDGEPGSFPEAES